MGIRQLPAGAFQMHFQHDRASYAATYPTRELGEDAEPLLRAAVRARRYDAYIAEANEAPPSSSPAPSAPPTPTLGEVRSSSAAAAESINAILADVTRPQHLYQGPAADEVLTTGQSAVLPGVSRPTLVAGSNQAASCSTGAVPTGVCTAPTSLPSSNRPSDQVADDSRRTALARPAAVR
jgi:hypothetical protein